MEDENPVESLVVKVDPFPTEEDTSNDFFMDGNPGVQIKTEPPDLSASEDSLEQEMIEIPEPKIELKTEEIAPQRLLTEDGYIVPDNPTIEESGQQRLFNVYDAQPEDSKWLTQVHAKVKTPSPVSIPDDALTIEVEQNSQPRSRRKQVLKPLEDPPEKPPSPASIRDEEEDGSQSRSRRKQVLKPIEDLLESDQLNLLRTQMAQKKSANKKTVYHCKDCGRQFFKHASFEAHEKQHIKTTCAICQSEFKSMDALHDHVFSHYTGKGFSCIICKKFYRSVGRLAHHLTYHPGIKPFKCSSCEHRFSLLSYLARHEKNCKITRKTECENVGYRCVNCQKTFASATSLKQHVVKNICTQPYECCYCKDSFNSPKSLSLHVRNLHSDVKTYNCSVCGHPFRLGYMLIRHSNVLNVKCQLCKKGIL